MVFVYRRVALFKSVNLKGLFSDHCLHELTVTMTNHPSSMRTSGHPHKKPQIKNVSLTVRYVPVAYVLSIIFTSSAAKTLSKLGQ